MQESEQNPKDNRVRKIRKDIRKVGRELEAIRAYVDALPEPFREDVKRQMLRAFEAGRAFSALENVPEKPPVDESGMLRIGPALREHILETRKVYADLGDLRDVAAGIFEKSSEDLLREIVREETVSGTDIMHITVMEEGER